MHTYFNGEDLRINALIKKFAEKYTHSTPSLAS